MSEVSLDLDALAPKPKKVKINGRVVDCYPPRVLQLVEIAQVWQKVQNNEVPSSEVVQAIKGVLEPIIPAIKDDPSIDFSYQQLVALMKFAQDSAVQEAPQEVQQAAPVEKKTATAEQ